MRTKNNNLMIAIAVFIICLIVHTAEVFFIRTDETIFAECFINKVFGIVALFAILKIWNKKWRDIGFKFEKLFNVRAHLIQPLRAQLI